ncbi:MAG: quinolinate synthase NadA, partial [Thermoleophilaceae bacterium]
MKPIELPTLSPAGEASLSPEQIDRLQSEVRALAEERNAVILAHNYQVPEVQDVAHFVGDSLGLSRQAAATDSDVIAFCGVHFMAETAKILNPKAKVVIPDLKAGCSLADGCPPEAFAAFVAEHRAQHPDLVVVSYVNTSAAVKALSDVICTSSNAVEIVAHFHDRPVLFAPDRYLAAWVAKEAKRPDLIIWPGS